MKFSPGDVVKSRLKNALYTIKSKGWGVKELRQSYWATPWGGTNGNKTHVEADDLTLATPEEIEAAVQASLNNGILPPL